MKLSFNFTGTIPRSLLRKTGFDLSQGPSFPHACSGNPGETLTGPPIKTFGGDDFGKTSTLTGGSGLCFFSTERVIGTHLASGAGFLHGRFKIPVNRWIFVFKLDLTAALLHAGVS